MDSGNLTSVEDYATRSYLKKKEVVKSILENLFEDKVGRTITSSLFQVRPFNKRINQTLFEDNGNENWSDLYSPLYYAAENGDEVRAISDQMLFVQSKHLGIMCNEEMESYEIYFLKPLLKQNNIDFITTNSFLNAKTICFLRRYYLFLGEVFKCFLSKSESILLNESIKDILNEQPKDMIHIRFFAEIMIFGFCAESVLNFNLVTIRKKIIMLLYKDEYHNSVDYVKVSESLLKNRFSYLFDAMKRMEYMGSVIKAEAQYIAYDIFEESAKYNVPFMSLAYLVIRPTSCSNFVSLNIVRMQPDLLEFRYKIKDSVIYEMERQILSKDEERKEVKCDYKVYFDFFVQCKLWGFISKNELIMISQFFCCDDQLVVPNIASSAVIKDIKEAMYVTSISYRSQLIFIKKCKESIRKFMDFIASYIIGDDVLEE